MKSLLNLSDAAQLRQVLTAADSMDKELAKMGLMRNAEFPKFREAVLDYIDYGAQRFRKNSFEAKAIRAVQQYAKTDNPLDSSISALREYYAIPNRVSNAKFRAALKGGKIAAPLNEAPVAENPEGGSDPEPFQNWIEENYGYDASSVTSIQELSKLATRLELGLKP